jgi:hypothetical protein
LPALEATRSGIFGRSVDGVTAPRNNAKEQRVTQHVLFIVTNAAVIGPHRRKTGFFFAEVACHENLATLPPRH